MNAPLFITRRNCDSVIGESWSWCVRRAGELGVDVVRAGRKRLIPAAAFVAALKAAPRSAEPETQEDAAAVVRRALGRRRAA